ncbi:Fe-S protein assembly co-chaperone HscB [Chitinivorax sp. PXF-14]|uniref:Fe-S protein assembly co-chaperone HscB n=1 Tax=Chitinivorax sp. PXF-14 TaxID=3230488 RepID=UPI003465E38B
MSIDFSKTHFQLFDLPQSYALDVDQLERAYRRIQSEVHPDRFAHLGDAEKRLSLQWATQANAAYQTLKKPLARARYLLLLNGVDTQEETNTAMPADFLMAQMEWREAIADARHGKDVDALEQLSGRLRDETHTLQATLGKQLDQDGDFAGAALGVRKLKFLEKLDEEIGDALEILL